MATDSNSRVEQLKEMYPTEGWGMRFQSAVTHTPISTLRERKAERMEKVDS